MNVGTVATHADAGSDLWRGELAAVGKKQKNTLVYFWASVVVAWSALGGIGAKAFNLVVRFVEKRLKTIRSAAGCIVLWMRLKRAQALLKRLRLLAENRKLATNERDARAVAEQTIYLVDQFRKSHE